MVIAVPVQQVKHIRQIAFLRSMTETGRREIPMAHEVIDFEDARLRQHDHIVRGTAADGMIRAIACTAKETVEEAHQNHNTSPLVTAALGRLLMAGQMMGQMSKADDELITLTVRGDGPIEGLTVTANNRGQVKGFAHHAHVWLPLKEDGHLDVGAGIGHGELSVVFDRPGIAPYSSQVELVSSEIGEDLTNYFVLSDQVPSSVGVGVLVAADTSVRQAGGFIIQLMPGASDELIDMLESRLKGIDSMTAMLDRGMSPEDILRHILGDTHIHHDMISTHRPGTWILLIPDISTELYRSRDPWLQYRVLYHLLSRDTCNGLRTHSWKNRTKYTRYLCDR